MTRVVALLPIYLFGGAEHITDMLVRRLRPLGFEFTLVTQARCAEKRADSIATLFNGVIGLDCDLTHYSPAVTAAVADAICPMQADVLWMIGDEFADIPTLRAALKPGGRVVYHLHSVPFFQVGLKTNSPFKKLQERLLKKYSRRYSRRTLATLQGVDSYVTLCQGYARRLQALYPAEASKILSVYNPVDEIEPVAAAKQPVVMFLGRLTHADKRPDLLLRAFAPAAASRPKWRLRLVGDGPERPVLEALAAELGIADRTEFCGYCDNPVPLLAESSILCLTSAIEGWGMAMVEAMQCGVVPMAFDCSEGVHELLDRGRGVLVEPGNVAAYSAALGELMDSPERRAEICETHPGFLATLAPDRIAAQWCALFGGQSVAE